jgi:hypothetical protein
MEIKDWDSYRSTMTKNIRLALHNADPLALADTPTEGERDKTSAVRSARRRTSIILPVSLAV